MELKFVSLGNAKEKPVRSNRTFMELKYEGSIGLLQSEYGSNRTFMELKCSLVRFWTKKKLVLIVPLWN